MNKPLMCNQRSGAVSVTVPGALDAAVRRYSNGCHEIRADELFSELGFSGIASPVPPRFSRFAVYFDADMNAA